jgi:hypothetical protein
MARAARLTSLVILALGLAYACGSSLPVPKVGQPPEATINYVEVPYPPPAAQVEIVPPIPQEGAVWVDGEWSWQGRRWTWESGGWVIPPSGSYFAPWRTKRLDNGKLFFAAGSWRATNDQPLPKPPVIVPAQSNFAEDGGS